MSPSLALETATHQLRFRRLLIPSAAYRQELADRVSELQNKARNRLGSPYRAASFARAIVAGTAPRASGGQGRPFSDDLGPFVSQRELDNGVDPYVQCRDPLKTPDNRVGSALKVQTYGKG